MNAAATQQTSRLATSQTQTMRVVLASGLADSWADQLAVALHGR